MKAKKTADANISCDVIQVFKTEPYDKYNRTDLRVVKWSGGKCPVLEKRRVWNLKDGKMVHRQLVGFTSDDVDFIVSNQQAIKNALKGVKEDGNEVADSISGVHS
jgi:hypothetical protein